MNEPKGRALWLATLILACAVASGMCTAVSAQVLASSARPIPAWAHRLSCTAGGNRVPLKTGSDGLRLELPCHFGNVLLVCDGDGIEPLDIPLDAVCKGQKLPLAPGMRVTLQSQAAEAMTIEWLDVPVDGAVTLSATRAIPLRNRRDIFVAATPDRFVRISRDGVSPVTLPQQILLHDAIFEVPPGRSGGELVARVSPSYVRPTTYRLTGRWNMDVAVDQSSNILVHGLMPGAYELVPGFIGGITGKPVAVTVEQGVSTTLTVPREAVGAARIFAAASACPRATDLTVGRISGVDRPIRHDPIVIPRFAGCEWKVAGLAPGRYEARLAAVTGLIGSVEFTVGRDQVSSVTIAGSGVTVQGRIMSGGRALADATLSFSRRAGAGLVWATTDYDGTYSATLDAAGEYTILLYQTTLQPQSRQVTIESGHNTIDWHIAAGSLTVRLTGWDGATSAVVYLERAGATSSTRLTGGDEPVWVQRGLRFGVYKVFARTDSGLTSREAALVTLDESNPDASVELDLLPSRRRLLVRDPSGLPIRGARFHGVFPTLVEIDAGVYALDGVAPGTRLRIIPVGEFVPVCRTVKESGLEEVIVARGRTLEIEVPGGTTFLKRAFGSLVGLPGSDCAVPLSDFHASTPASGAGRSAVFVVRGFPALSTVTLDFDDGPRRVVQVPEQGRLRLIPSPDPNTSGRIRRQFIRQLAIPR